MNNNEIQLIQSPIIKHSLVDMGKSVSERLDALNLDNQVATDETVKTLKATRAELTKEEKEFEEQRKAVKNAILSPYSEFEKVYKSEIIDKYKSADETLKVKINDFEMTIKNTKRIELMEYFKEVVDMLCIDWLTFDRLKIDVNLSTSMKKYKEQVLSDVQKVADDIEFINGYQYPAEALVEYKSSLKVTEAIDIVRKRKEAERIEAERLLTERTSKRVATLQNLTFTYSDLARSYKWKVGDREINIPLSYVESLADDDWFRLYDRIKRTIEANGRPAVLHAPTESAPQAPAVLQSPAVSSPNQDSPTPDQKEFEIIFSITASEDQIKKLGVFLRENGYSFKQLN
ncbi:DUF1351 domain-containing protein [Dysgonomonas sp. GY75]|uniref:DUF1351 domain-containing protein n=1 Tax=Dysgonomonas sp. GY75 TaxID=2780419 RepID=UPI0018844047|nr:DUF1351 domain-containing protein [Dysgonomonas sp. GY75]MBF0651683.1 DUF1351 domain-containing protein [Dysgonomonas sp. GY75]